MTVHLLHSTQWSSSSLPYWIAGSGPLNPIMLLCSWSLRHCWSGAHQGVLSACLWLSFSSWRYKQCKDQLKSLLFLSVCTENLQESLQGTTPLVSPSHSDPWLTNSNWHLLNRVSEVKTVYPLRLKCLVIRDAHSQQRCRWMDGYCEKSQQPTE